MKRALTYFAGGIELGLIIVLIPLIALTELNFQYRISQSSYSQSKSLPDELRGIEGGSSTLRVSATDLEPLAISLVAAVVVYLMVRRRIPSQDRGSPRMVPS